MATTLLPIGVQLTISQGVVYALPATFVQPYSNTDILQYSLLVGGSFNNLIGSDASPGPTVKGGFIRCMLGATTVRVNKPKMKKFITAYNQVVLADKPSNYWRLNEANGTVASDIVGGANGTISGGVTLNQSGPLSDDKCMLFDGVDDKITSVVNITFPLICTIEGWMKTTYTAAARNPVISSRALGGSGDIIAMGLSFGGPIAIDSNAISALGLISSILGSWNHLVCVLNGSTVSFFLNGVFDRTQSFVRNTPYVGLMTIGWDTGSAAGNGSLDEVAIYPYALSAAQILKHYQARV